MIKKYSFVIIILFFIVMGFFLGFQENFSKKIEKNNIKYVKIAGQTIKIELAMTPEEQERGLSGRKSMAQDEGMLFVFGKAGKYFFWMKDMNFPIDIIWIDKNFKITFLQKNVEPSSYPNTFGPPVDNSYVLEVLAGFSEKNNLKAGDRVEFLR